MPDWAVKHGAFKHTASDGSRMSAITPQVFSYPTTTVDVWLYKPVSLFATVSLFSCWPLAVFSRRCAGLRFYCSPNTPSYSLEANMCAVLMNDQSNSDSNEKMVHNRQKRRRKKKKVAGKVFVSPPLQRLKQSGRHSSDGIDKIDHISIGKVGYELASGSGGLCEPLPGALPFSSVLSPSLCFFYVIFSACISAVVCNSALPLSVTAGNDRNQENCYKVSLTDRRTKHCNGRDRKSNVPM